MKINTYLGMIPGTDGMIGVLKPTGINAAGIHVAIVDEDATGVAIGQDQEDAVVLDVVDFTRINRFYF